MTYSSWDALKDLFGAAGPVFIAVPWLKDFWLRRRKSRVEQVSATGRLGRLKASIEDSMRRKIESPKMSDFAWTTVGLLLIFASFAIALIRGLDDLLPTVG
jgi:hypothetical protein